MRSGVFLRTFASAFTAIAASACGTFVTTDPGASDATATAGGTGGTSNGPSTTSSTAATGGSGGAGGREEWPCELDGDVVHGTGSGGFAGELPGCVDPPGTEILVTDWKLMDYHTRLATDASYVYSSYYGDALVRIPKSGGDVEVFAPDEVVVALSLTETHAYWDDWGVGTPIRVKPLAGGPVTTLASTDPETGLWDIVADPRDVYFSTVWYDNPHLVPGLGGVFRVSAEGGTPTKLADASLNPYDIEIDDEHVFYYDRGCPMRVPKAGGTPSLMLEHAIAPFNGSIAVDDEAVYYAGGPIVRVPKDGSTVTVIVDVADNIGHIALDGDYVYWSSSGLDYIARTPKTGGTTEYVVGCAKAPVPEQFIIDAGWLYWRGGKGDVLKRAPI